MKYGSRKFIITLVGMIGSAGLASFGMLTPELSTIILTGMGTYNAANAFSVNKNEKPE